MTISEYRAARQLAAVVEMYVRQGWERADGDGMTFFLRRVRSERVVRLDAAPGERLRITMINRSDVR